MATPDERRATVNLVMQAVDRYAARVVSSIHRVFGFTYRENEEYFVYVLGGTLTTAGGAAPTGTISDSLRISQAKGFVWFATAASVRFSGSGATGVIGHAATVVRAGDLVTANNLGQLEDVPVSAMLTDGGSDRQMMSEALDLHTYAGSGASPNRLMKPRFFKPNSSISAVFTALYDPGIANVTLRVEMDLLGWHITTAGPVDVAGR